MVKLEIEDSFGRKVLTARDCEELSGEIYLKTGQRIHTNTLRRLFGIIKADYKPSLSTLLILAKYCGYSSLDELKTSTTEEKDELKIDSSNVLRFVYSFFQQTQVSGYNDATFLSQMPILIRFINHNVPIAERISKLIAHTRNGQDFYFEQCINFDRLNSYYGDGLRHYLAEKTDIEAQLFGHSLLAFRGWLTMNNDLLDREYKIVCGLKPSVDIHPLTRARYYSVAIYHSTISGADTKEIVLAARSLYSNLKPPSRPYEQFPTLTQALTLTGNYKEALSIIDLYTNYKSPTGEVYQVYNDIFLLLKAYALCRTGKKKEAAGIIKNINPTEFNFLSRKYKTILYLLTLLELNGDSEKPREQLNHLLETTGFKRLEKLMSAEKV